MITIPEPPVPFFLDFDELFSIVSSRNTFLKKQKVPFFKERYKKDIERIAEHIHHVEDLRTEDLLLHCNR